MSIIVQMVTSRLCHSEHTLRIFEDKDTQFKGFEGTLTISPISLEGVLGENILKRLYHYLD